MSALAVLGSVIASGKHQPVRNQTPPPHRQLDKAQELKGQVSQLVWAPYRNIGVDSSKGRRRLPSATSSRHLQNLLIVSGLGCLSRHPYFLRRHEPCSSVHSLSFTKHQGYRMSTATPLDQSLQRTISTLNLQTIKEDMENKELLIIKDQKHSALKATLASKLPRASTEGQDRLMDQPACSASLF